MSVLADVWPNAALLTSHTFGENDRPHPSAREKSHQHAKNKGGVQADQSKEK